MCFVTLEGTFEKNNHGYVTRVVIVWSCIVGNVGSRVLGS